MEELDLIPGTEYFRFNRLDEPYVYKAKSLDVNDDKPYIFKSFYNTYVAFSEYDLRKFVCRVKK